MLNKYNANQINQKLMHSGLGNYKVIVHEELASTNIYALDHIEQLENNSVIVCEVQRAGLGRNGKDWTSRPYIDISVSFVHEFPLDFNYELLPLVIAVATNRLFKQLRISTKIKWPNDILTCLSTDKSKIAGILLSAKIHANKRYIVTGIGLNNIGNWERNSLLLNLITQVENVLSEYKMFGFATVRQEWLDNCIHYRKVIRLYQGGKLLDRGIHIDLTSNGKIRIEDQNSGEIREYSGATVSLMFEDQ